jgi:hypothetical protein
MSLVARLLDSSQQAWEPMASSSVNFCRKTRTVHSPWTGLLLRLGWPPHHLRLLLLLLLLLYGVNA